jgi:hypothetical protein
VRNALHNKRAVKAGLESNVPIWRLAEKRPYCLEPFREEFPMKWIMVLMMLFSAGAMAQTQWHPERKAPVAQLTPVAAKCDLSSCQQNCYVQQSQCKNDNGGGCGSLAQICVQNCSNECR